MRLDTVATFTDAEWDIATDVHHSLQAGGPLSLRERQLAAVCGSTERALQVLAAVRRAEAHLDRILALPQGAPEFYLSPAPQPTPASSERRAARRTATARAARTERALGIAATTVVAMVPVLTAINAFRGGN